MRDILPFAIAGCIIEEILGMLGKINKGARRKRPAGRNPERHKNGRETVKACSK